LKLTSKALQQQAVNHVCCAQVHFYPTHLALLQTFGSTYHQKENEGFTFRFPETQQHTYANENPTESPGLLDPSNINSIIINVYSNDQRYTLFL